MVRKTKGKIIEEKAFEIIENNPNGIRYSDLVKQISEALPDMKIKYIHGKVWDLDKRFPDKVYKPSIGIYVDTKYKEPYELVNIEKIERPPDEKEKNVREEDFYQPFANWLMGDIEGCSDAKPIGGNILGRKWSTPDVIGIKVARGSDIIKYPTEIISAEIKLDTNELITAFGQSCSYKLFSNKSYLVIPKDSSEEDLSRLDSLCLIFGLGFVLFDRYNQNNPDFIIRVRPVKHEPDIFYMNEIARILEKNKILFK